MDAETMRGILKREYGINSQEEFDEAFRKSPGIDIGLFTMPLPTRRKNNEKTDKALATA